MAGERAQSGVVLAHVALQRGVPELRGGLIAGLLGEGDAGGGEAHAVPRQEHSHGEHDRAERRDQEAVSGAIARHRGSSSARSPRGLIYRPSSKASIAAWAPASQASASPGSARRNPTGISLRSAIVLTICSPSARASPGTVPAA